MNNLLSREAGDMVRTEVKSIWLSKTLWFNVITLLLGVIGIVSQSPLFVDKTQVLEVLAMVSSFGNVILRLLTTQPVSLK